MGSTNKGNVIASSSTKLWHGHLGHPSFKILNKLIQNGSVSLASSSSFDYVCHSCLCNKSRRLPFCNSSLESRGPLNLVYTDV